jgi:hypothetical protein
MKDDCAPESVGDVLERVEEAGGAEERVTVGDIVHRIGEGAFPPLILVPALIIVTPASAIVGLSTFFGVMIALVAVQMVLGRDRLWLPSFILDRTVPHRRLERFIAYADHPGRILDRLTRRRLTMLVDPPLARLWALVCMLLALVIPALELVPMSATIIAATISLFALAMLARDGLLIVIGLLVLAGAVGLALSIAAAA